MYIYTYAFYWATSRSGQHWRSQQQSQTVALHESAMPVTNINARRSGMVDIKIIFYFWSIIVCYVCSGLPLFQAALNPACYSSRCRKSTFTGSSRSFFLGPRFSITTIFDAATGAIFLIIQENRLSMTFNCQLVYLPLRILLAELRRQPPLQVRWRSSDNDRGKKMETTMKVSDPRSRSWSSVGVAQRPEAFGRHSKTHEDKQGATRWPSYLLYIHYHSLENILLIG